MPLRAWTSRTFGPAVKRELIAGTDTKASRPSTASTLLLVIGDPYDLKAKAANEQPTAQKDQETAPPISL